MFLLIKKNFRLVCTIPRHFANIYEYSINRNQTLDQYLYWSNDGGSWIIIVQAKSGKTSRIKYLPNMYVQSFEQRRNRSMSK
mmetsp:Transcript_19644/g.29406  ORF Transcript_19644/g.29406 Transcript_19644/m.29406 type:complete len:82 (-) Transcript_19644:29-274(-)